MKTMDGKGRYSDNSFVERLWRTVKYEEVHLNVRSATKPATGGLLPVLQPSEAPQALGYRTPAEVRRAGSRLQYSEQLAGAAGPSLNSALILSK